MNTSIFELSNKVFSARPHSWSRKGSAMGTPTYELISLLKMLQVGDEIAVKGMEDATILATIGHAANFLDSAYQGEVEADGTVTIKRIK